MSRNGRGKTVVAIVSPEDLAPMERLIEEAEDRLDGEAADRALAEMHAKEETPIPWQRIEEEDRIDACEVRRIRTRIEAGKEKTIPWEQVKKNLAEGD